MKKLFIAAILFVSSSCIKVIDPESNYITGDQLASSADALAGMVRAIPVRLVNYQNDDAGIEQCSYHGMLSMLEMMTTDMVVSGYGGFNTTSAYTYGNLSARGSNRGIYPFYMYYGYIKAVNDVIGLIDSETDDTTLKHYLGIAKAYRALFYMQVGAIYEYKAPTDSRYTEYYVAPEHDLTELTVPIVTETTTGLDVKNNPRATFDTLYEFILSDLKNAETLLADYTPSSKVYPSLAVVYGLYARAYMEMASHKNATENYMQALNYA
ncbi:RagB/SusD family nutrient uptake outer membrane protein, partial [Alistipes onderdonkii]|uniref:RagB/SusD family nutrient uptake outer membrane protein n=2 Tax=Alistipes TaxID=239759 RepID=UPI0034A2C324